MMETCNLTLNSELLMDELVKWQIKNGKGRDENDLRFGQYILCKYEMKDMFDNSKLATFNSDMSSVKDARYMFYDTSYYKSKNLN